VVLGAEYALEGLSWAGEGGDIIVEVSDPVLADAWGGPRDEETIVLTLRTKDGQEATCRPHAGESRRFHSSQGVADGAALGSCGLAFRGLYSELPVYTVSPTMPTTTTEPDPCPECCTCPDSEWDWRCHDPTTDPLGGLACMGCGVQECRICGVGDPYPPCQATTPWGATTTTDPTGPTTTVPPLDGCDCHPGGTVSDPRCHDCGNDPWGCLGCMACGVKDCRSLLM
jgi:hypothetical protein